MESSSWTSTMLFACLNESWSWWWVWRNGHGPWAMEIRWSVGGPHESSCSTYQDYQAYQDEVTMPYELEWVVSIKSACIRTSKEPCMITWASIQLLNGLLIYKLVEVEVKVEADDSSWIEFVYTLLPKNTNMIPCWCLHILHIMIDVRLLILQTDIVIDTNYHMHGTIRRESASVVCKKRWTLDNDSEIGDSLNHCNVELNQYWQGFYMWIKEFIWQKRNVGLCVWLLQGPRNTVNTIVVTVQCRTLKIFYIGRHGVLIFLYRTNTIWEHFDMQWASSSSS